MNQTTKFIVEEKQLTLTFNCFDKIFVTPFKNLATSWAIA